MARKIEAVIFDLDGVIADTVNLYYMANRMIADVLGITLSKEENDRFRGLRRMVVIEELAKKAMVTLNEDEKNSLSALKNSYYQNMIEGITPKGLKSGIAEFLEELTQQRLKIGLASSSTNANAILERLQIIQYFDTIVDPEKLSKGKPDPEIFFTAADMLQLSYENCVAIEDSEVGLKAILKTPMFSIGIGKNPFMQNAHWHINCTSQLNYKELHQHFFEWR